MGDTLFCASSCKVLGFNILYIPAMNLQFIAQGISSVPLFSMGCLCFTVLFQFSLFTACIR
uniref:Uncharacterized protein n=1 Tax=Nelumbo nucifera TaxID=4432 RepID=A0A822ZMR9_NELNU|nr:TPA_asm: hypothetical protein HUJ06_017251 [Nelumbo nucifera]